MSKSLNAKRAAGHAALVVPRAGIEPARPFRAKGFSYHYGFRHHFCLWSGPTMAFATISVCGLDYSFTMGFPLGVPCLVSAPSSIQRLGSRLPSALSVKVSLNLRHSTSLFSESALNCLSPSCLPFHHQGVMWECKGSVFLRKSQIWEREVVKVPLLARRPNHPLLTHRPAAFLPALSFSRMRATCSRGRLMTRANWGTLVLVVRYRYGIIRTFMSVSWASLKNSSSRAKV